MQTTPYVLDLCWYAATSKIGDCISEYSGQVNEGSSTINSQMALAFIARLVDILRTLPKGVSSRSTPIGEGKVTSIVTSFSSYSRSDY